MISSIIRNFNAIPTIIDNNITINNSGIIVGIDYSQDTGIFIISTFSGNIFYSMDNMVTINKLAGPVLSNLWEVFYDSMTNFFYCVGKNGVVKIENNSSLNYTILSVPGEFMQIYRIADKLYTWNALTGQIYVSDNGISFILHDRHPQNQYYYHSNYNPITGFTAMMGELNKVSYNNTSNYSTAWMAAKFSTGGDCINVIDDYFYLLNKRTKDFITFEDAVLPSGAKIFKHNNNYYLISYINVYISTDLINWTIYISLSSYDLYMPSYTSCLIKDNTLYIGGSVQAQYISKGQIIAINLI